MQHENRDNGNDAVEQRNGSVRHGNAGELGNEQRNDEFEGLHFSDLAFSHQPHDDKQHDEDDRRADHNESHNHSIYFF